MLTFSRGDVISPEALEAAYSSRSIRSQLTSTHLTCIVIPSRFVATERSARSSLMPRAVHMEMGLQFVRKILMTIDAFRGLTDEQLNQIITSARRVTFAKGEAIISEGNKSAAEMYIVTHGTAYASRKRTHLDNDDRGGKGEARPSQQGPSVEDLRGTSSLGEEPTLTTPSDAVPIGAFDVGDHFGAASIVAHENGSSITHTISVSAPLATVKCLVLSRAAFGRLLPHVEHKLRGEIDHRKWLVRHRNRVTLSELYKGQLIGTGTYGRVRLATHKETGEAYAVKIVDKAKIMTAKEQVTNARNERALLASCNHPFLLKLVAAYQSNLAIFFIIELVIGGELFTLLDQKGSFDMSMARFYAANVNAALGYFRELGVVYRDLKPENVLLQRDGYAKVIDFGFAKSVADGQRTFTFCGTPEYMAPEIVEFIGYDHSIDMWALGIFIYDMMNGATPFQSRDGDLNVVFDNILNHKRQPGGVLRFPWVWRFFNADAESVIRTLLHSTPESRPSPRQLWQHPFFAMDADAVLALERKEVQPPFVPTLSSATDTSRFDDIDDDSDNESELEDDVPDPSQARRGSSIKAAITGQFPGFLLITDKWRRREDEDEAASFSKLAA
uniref:cGMP-dependent protein kinase n=1 Tax=Haptolina brevifila TaxID=156173 RepID=A0A7S2JD82_9EUKA